MSVKINDIISVGEIDKIKVFKTWYPSCCLIEFGAGAVYLEQGNAGAHVVFELSNLNGAQVEGIEINNKPVENINSITIKLLGADEYHAMIHGLEFAANILKEAENDKGRWAD